MNKIIEKVNLTGEQVEILTNSFNALKDYVDNYFENLDVQEEINNKLDEMVEQGTLQEIISEYLNSIAIFGFDTVSSMKSATNLINGSYAKTLGFYSLNDGGGATYKIRTITNDDVVDEMFLIEIGDPQDELVAELVIENNIINFKQIGVKANDNSFTDNATKINTIINRETKYKFYLPEGDYYLTNSIIITRKADDFIFYGDGHKSDTNGQKTGTALIYNGTDFAMIFEQRIWKGKMSDFEIYSENGSGLKFIGNISSGTNFNDIFIKVKDTGIKIQKSGYSFWYNVDVMANSNATNFKGIDATYVDGAIEYLYFNGCTFSSYNEDNSNSYGIYATHLNHFYMDDCDFVGLDYGLYIHSVYNTKCVNVTNTNFACNVNNIYLKSQSNSIGGVYISECSFSIRVNNGKVLKIERQSPYLASGIIFNNNHIADIQSGITTDELISIANGSIDFTTCTFANNGYNKNTSTKFITMPSTARTYNPIDHNFIKPINLRLNNNGTASSYEYTITNNSPFTETPAIVIADSKGLITNYTLSNTNGGEFKVNINFSEAWNGNNYIGIHVLNNCINDWKTIS